LAGKIGKGREILRKWGRIGKEREREGSLEKAIQLYFHASQVGWDRVFILIHPHRKLAPETIATPKFKIKCSTALQWLQPL